MENKQLERRDNHPARRSLWKSMNAALARIALAGEPKQPRLSAEARGFTVPASAGGRVVAQVCVCAVFDLPFMDRFERQASGVYCPVESRRMHDGGSSGAGVEIRRALNVDEIRGAYMPCPWCGEDGNMRYHCDCGGVVCGGKVRGKMFHCRASCGLSWPVGHPVHEIKVTEERGRSEWQAPPRRGSAWQAPAKQADSACLLLPPARRK